MQVIIEDIEKFKVFFDVIYDVASDIIELQFQADKLVCAVLDRARTRFFHAEYDLEFFENYAIEQVSSISVFTEDLYKLLKLANKTDSLIIDFDESLMMCKLISKTGNRRVFEFALPNDFLDSPKLPTVDVDCVIELDTFDMKQSVKDINLIGTDVFQIVVSPESVTYMSDATTMIDVAASTKYAQTIEMPTGINEQLSVRFNIDYISQMLKFEKISNMVELRIDPRALFYKFMSGGVIISGMIAPRVEEEV